MNRTAIITAAVAATIITGGGAVAVAATTSTPAPIRACVLHTTGATRIVNTACKSTETARTWNVQGVSGPAGPQGPSGLAAVKVIEATQSVGSPASSVTLTCPADDIVINAGYQLTTGNEPVYVLADIVSADLHSWLFRAGMNTPTNVQLRVECAPGSIH